MANVIYTAKAVITKAANMAADGEDTRFLASEQAAYAEQIAEVTRRVWEDGEDVDAAVAAVMTKWFVAHAAPEAK